MSEWFVNPRRSPRLPLRYPVLVETGGGTWSAETEDVGPKGCQLVLARPLLAGEVVRLSIDAAAAGRPLPVAGRVAWAGDRGRHRAGIQFSPGQPGSDPAAWFRRLVKAEPTVGTAASFAPERLPPRTPLFLRPPPTFIVDLSPEEAALVRAIRDGVAIADLVAAAAHGPALATRLVFALLDRRVLTLSVSDAAPAWRWHALLDEADRGPAPSRSRPAPAPPASPGPVPVPEAPAVHPVAVEAAPASGAPLAPAAPTPAASVAVPPAPSLYGATERTRPSEAQECLDRARAAASAGEIAGAIALLRRALALAPRDPEVSAELGKLAFRDRTVGKG